jgi:hypothetical protein
MNGRRGDEIVLSMPAKVHPFTLREAGAKAMLESASFKRGGNVLALLAEEAFRVRQEKTGFPSFRRRRDAVGLPRRMSWHEERDTSNSGCPLLRRFP